jgi:hypothetical protein
MTTAALARMTLALATTMALGGCAQADLTLTVCAVTADHPHRSKARPTKSSERRVSAARIMPNPSQPSCDWNVETTRGDGMSLRRGLDP